MTTLNLLLNDLFELSKSYTPPASYRTVDQINVSVPEGSSLSTNISTYTFSLIIALPSGQAFVYTLTPSTATAFEQLNIPVDFSVGGATIQILVTGESDTEIGESDKISLLPQYYKVKPDTLTIVENDTYDVSEYDKVIVNVGGIDELNAALEKTLVGSESSSYEPENPINENISQAISDFEDIKGAIEDKGVEVPAGTPTSEYADLIGEIPSGDDSVLISLIDRTATSFTIPDGTTAIGDYAFYYANLTSMIIPSSVTSIGSFAVAYTHLSEIVVPGNVKTLGQRAYSYNNYAGRIVLEEGVEDIGSNSLAMIGLQSTTTPKVQPVTIPASVKYVRGSAFDGTAIETLIISKPTSTCLLYYRCFGSMYNLKTVYLPNANLSLYNTSADIFGSDSNLEYVILENNYDIAHIDFSVSTKYSVDTLVGMLNALKDNSGTSAKTLTIGSTNINKLTAEQITIATNKNWNLA